MSDDRVFATGKMDRSFNWKGEPPLPDKPEKELKIIYRKEKKHYRWLVYPLYILFLILDWVVVLAANITEIVSVSIKTLALHLESYINNGQKPNLPKSDSEDE